ncbi:MAG: YlbF family regulator [Peptostreptococcaceae bacterium]
MGVYDTTTKLANDIRNSKEYKEFRKYMVEVKSDKETENLLREYRVLQVELQRNAMNNKKMDKKSMMRLESIQKKVASNKTIHNYLVSEQKFTTMMESINKILANVMEKDYK